MIKKIVYLQPLSKYKTNYYVNNNYIQQISGKRLCLGESLAKVELYLFMSALLQRYDISKAPGEPLDIKINKDNWFVNTIRPFKVVLKKRI